MAEYLPPESTKLPFNFTTQGYASPGSTSILFDFAPQGTFGTLKAAVNVMQPYWYTTHTYAKSCPKYVVGYGSGGVQIIKGRCLYGGIRDLQGIITGLPKGLTTSTLPVYINSVLNNNQSDLSLYCYAISPSNLSAYSETHLPKDIRGYISGVKKKDSGNLSTFIDTHSPGTIHSYIGVHLPATLRSSLTVLKHKSSGDINSLIDTHLSISLSGNISADYPRNIHASLRSCRQEIKDLNTYITVIKNKSLQYMSSIISAHLPTVLGASIKIIRSDYANLPSSIKLWTDNNLNSTIDAHRWGSLNAIVGSFGKGVGDLNSYIFVEKYKGYSSVTSEISTHTFGNLKFNITGVKSDLCNIPSSVHGFEIAYLNATIDTHSSVNIGSSIKGWYSTYKNLRGTIRSWYTNNYQNLSTAVDSHFPVYLQSVIGTHQPSNMLSFIGGHIHNHIYSIIRSWHRNLDKYLMGNIRGWQSNTISSTIGGHLHSNLNMYLRVWQSNITIDFPSYIHSWEKSPDMTAIIFSHGPEKISSTIRGWGTEIQKILTAKVRSWQVGGLSSEILSHQYVKIYSSIRGWANNINRNLYSSIKGWQSSDLGGAIDSHIWAILGATVFPHPPPPIYSSIRGWASNIQKDLDSHIYGWDKGNISSTIGGHLYKSLNILLKSIHIGIISDLSSSLHGWQQADLSMTVKGGHVPSNLGILMKGVVVGDIKNISSNLHGWQTSDLGISIKGGHSPINMIGYINIFQSTYKNLKSSIYGWQDEELTSNIDGHISGKLSSSIRSFYINKEIMLRSAIYGWQSSDLPSMISSHTPEILRGMIKGEEVTSILLPAYTYGWQISGIGIILKDTHFPENLTAQLQAKQRHINSLTALVHSWHIKNITAILNVVFPMDLQASLYPIEPVNLSSYLKPRLITTLPSYLKGWQKLDLTAAIYQIWDKYLSASIYSRTDTSKNLTSRIKGCGDAFDSLYGSIVAIYWKPLYATIRATYLSSISSYLYAIPPKNLSSRIKVWHERFLQAELNGQNYPWNLTAQIFPGGGLSKLNALIYPRKDREISNNLSIIIHSWETRVLSAFILVDNAPSLSAYLNTLGHTKDLHGSIRPKMIRLTTTINIPTQVHDNLSATINYPCFKTDYSTLYATVDVKYKGDLYAYIKPIYTNYRIAGLSASIGYTDAYLEIDKIKLSINIHNSEFFTEDKLKIMLRLLDAESLLTAYIRGTLRFTGISARIVADPIPGYSFGATPKNREIVINKTYDGIFKEFEIVEMLFKSTVKDYFYSTDGNFAWKSDKNDRWILNVKSILPPNTTIGTIRRLHKATSMYDFKKFKSVDDAIRAAMDHVTEYPQSNLGASIVNLGIYKTLGGIIVPRYIINSKNSLESTIIPVGNVILVNEKESVTKI